MKKIITFILIGMIIIVSGCGTSEQIEEQKKLFEIQTMKLHNEDNTVYITKNEKVQGTSEITITSQVSGKVQSVLKNIWDQVNQGTLLVQIQDTSSVGGPGSNNIREANLAFQRAQTSESITRADIEQQKRQLARDLNNLDWWLTGSTTQLQLSQLENQLIQAELDYNNTQNTTAQSASQFLSSLWIIKNDLVILLWDVINENDKTFGHTDIYASYEWYRNFRYYILWVNQTLKQESYSNYSSLNNKLTIIRDIDINEISQDNANDYISIYKSVLDDISEYFVLMQEVYVSLTVISDPDILFQAGQSRGIVSWLQVKFNTLNSQYRSQFNTMENFFASYDNNQEILIRRIDTLKSQIELTKKQLEDANFNANIGQERANLGFESQLKNAELWLQSARNVVEQAQIYASKFAIKSPLQASVADILVQLGQDIAPWTPIAKIVSQQQQIETSLSFDQVKDIRVWQKVLIDSELGTAQAKIANIADVADITGSFKVIISLDESTIPTWLSVKFRIPVQNGSLTLPINALKIVDTNKATAYLWDTVNKTIVPKTLNIEALFGEYVEIADMLSTDYELITSNISNFNKQLMDVMVDNQRHSIE